MAASDLKEAMRNTRDMDCYLEARSAQEVIQDMSELLSASAEMATLRDHFAGISLINFAGKIGSYSTIAIASYEMADAMLAERAKSSSLCEQEGGDRG